MAVFPVRWFELATPELNSGVFLYYLRRPFSRMPLMPFPTFARMSGPARGLLSLMLLGIAGCGELMVDPSANLPPCVDSTCNCGDFVSQELAQRVFDSYPNDPYDLDGDGNSLVCERLSATAPPLDRETYFSNSPHLVLGNPSRAGKENTDNYMIERDQYVLAYSQRYGRLLQKANPRLAKKVCEDRAVLILAQLEGLVLFVTPGKLRAQRVRMIEKELASLIDRAILAS